MSGEPKRGVALVMAFVLVLLVWGAYAAILYGISATPPDDWSKDAEAVAGWVVIIGGIVCVSSGLWLAALITDELRG